MPGSKTVVDGYYCPQIKSRWKSYSIYKLILWTWMMNEFTMMFTPAEISHNGFYVHAFIQGLAVIIIGMPLAYSELCMGQYTNCNVFEFWDFFPLFRNMGYAGYYVNFLKSSYLLVTSTWYLIYSFYSAMDTPPWVNCLEFNVTRCMVKRVNISIFQHCLEAQSLSEEGCGMKTASSFFFDREIGLNATQNRPHCYCSWKAMVGVMAISSLIYISSLKNEKIIQIVVKLAAIYMCGSMLMLIGMALSAKGTWYDSRITVHWTSYALFSCFNTLSRGFLTSGTGTGILIYLSRDISFRSPTTMTAISTCLFSYFVSITFALVAFNGIKTMSYYHGEEVRVIEIGPSMFFPVFASLSEVLTYFETSYLLGFLWFTVGLNTLCLNFWILYLHLKEAVVNSCYLAEKYSKTSSLILMVLIVLCSMPFLCSDLTACLTYALETMQTINSLILSISLYWIYGISKHSVDIIFMIGIKANYYWKVTWFLNPILISCLLYRSFEIIINIGAIQESRYVESLGISSDVLTMYVILGIYAFIIVMGIFMQIVKYSYRRNLRGLIRPKRKWGPKDKVLFRSRTMFLPEIMTREFLYRQVRIRGYQSNTDGRKSKVKKTLSVDMMEDDK